jgi:hypothetical protein
MMGGIGIQLADASGPNCPSKSGAATTVDPNAPDTANTSVIKTTPFLLIQSKYLDVALMRQASQMKFISIQV